jgi:hypothetical protein
MPKIWRTDDECSLTVALIGKGVKKHNTHALVDCGTDLHIIDKKYSQNKIPSVYSPLHTPNSTPMDTTYETAVRFEFNSLGSANILAAEKKFDTL